MAQARYPGTPLAKKLGIVANARVVAKYAPNNYVQLLHPLPPGVTFHLTASPVLSFSDEEARGTVLCRVEREAGDEWIVAGLTYSDRYVRRDGSWFFASRTSQVRYAADVLSRP